MLLGCMFPFCRSLLLACPQGGVLRRAAVGLTAHSSAQHRPKLAPHPTCAAPHPLHALQMYRDGGIGVLRPAILRLGGSPVPGVCEGLQARAGEGLRGRWCAHHMEWAQACG